MTVQGESGVTVVIPAYNAGMKVSAAVASALGQTRPPERIVVVDNGSTDSSTAVLSDMSPLVSVVSEQRRGTAVARNRGLACVDSRYVAFLDADDVWLPYHLAVATESLKHLPQDLPAIFCGTAVIVPVDGSPCRFSSAAEIDSPSPVDLLFANRIVTSGVVMSTSLRSRMVLRRLLPRNEDMLCWVEALAAGATFCTSPTPSLLYFHRPWSIGFRRPFVADCMTLPIAVRELGLRRLDIARVTARVVRRWCVVGCREAQRRSVDMLVKRGGPSSLPRAPGRDASIICRDFVLAPAQED